jgi:hypothetical protein
MVDVQILLFRIIKGSLLSLKSDAFTFFLFSVFLVGQCKIVAVKGSRNDEKEPKEEPVKPISRVKLKVDLIILVIRS